MVFFHILFFRLIVFQVNCFLRQLILWYCVMLVIPPSEWQSFLPVSWNEETSWKVLIILGAIFFSLKWIWGDVRKDGPAVTDLLVKWENMQWILSKFNPTDITPDQQNRKNNAQICHSLPHRPKILFCWSTPSSQPLKSMVWVPGTRCFAREILNNTTSPTKPEGHWHEEREKASLERSKADATGDNDTQESHKTEKRKWNLWKLLITNRFLLRLSQWSYRTMGRDNPPARRKPPCFCKWAFFYLSP